RRRVELARVVELALVFAAPDEGVELDARLAKGRELARGRDEDACEARVVKRLCVAADEVSGVEDGELPPGGAAVSAAGLLLLAEHGVRALTGFADVREGAPGRLRLGDGAQLEVHAAQLRARPTAELVRAERREEETRPCEPGELRCRDRPAAGR